LTGLDDSHDLNDKNNFTFFEKKKRLRIKIKIKMKNVLP